MNSVAARAVSIPSSVDTLTIRDDRQHAPGEVGTHRTIYTILSMFNMMVLSLLLGMISLPVASK